MLMRPHPVTSKPASCIRCPLTTTVPGVDIDDEGRCQLCRWFVESYDPRVLESELPMVGKHAAAGVNSKFDAMVGISGGKDSTATLARVLEMGHTPLAFTFDTGYYPEHITVRAAEVARQLGVEHVVIDLRPFVSRKDRAAFELTAGLFDEPDTPASAARFRDLYATGRRRFSIRNDDPIPYVRVCQLCRRLVVRAYYREAMSRGIRVVFLGTNEWAAQHSALLGEKDVPSAVRVLRPEPDDESVFVVHLPFLQRIKLADTAHLLARLGWQPPAGEDLVEGNANSCLLSTAAEAKAARLLGFHPDITRLAREATAGFLTRDQAATALSVVHDYPLTVRQVLHQAGVLR